MSVPLVPGELRGYRQFLLLADGLYPVVRWSGGAWEQTTEAACTEDPAHVPPARECTCGLYGWYDAISTTGTYGGVSAVISARGRVVLGDRGFRAASARIEAVALPPVLRLQPRAARRARAVLAERYPQVRVHSSRRAMLRAHPPQDVRELGVGPRDARRHHYRRAALVLWAVFVLAGYALLLLPRSSLADAARTWWPLLVALFLAWQAALIALFTRSQPSDRRSALD